MSKRETRVAKAWLVHYSKFDALPQRGVIVFGGGLDRKTWLDDASAAGYYVRDFGAYAELL